HRPAAERGARHRLARPDCPGRDSATGAAGADPIDRELHSGTGRLDHDSPAAEREQLGDADCLDDGSALVGWESSLIVSPNLSPMIWQLRDRALEFTPRALVLGIVNVTPDSFSDGGRYAAAEQAVAHGLE